MKQHGVNGYIVPNTDMYNNEYVPPADQRLTWLTDFTGSAGTALILDGPHAGFFTDSRYTIQAASQVHNVFFKVLNSHKTQDSDPTPIPHFIERNAKSGDVIGYDPRLISVNEFKTLSTELSALNITMQPIEQNLIDGLWTNKPAAPQSTVKLFDDKIAGKTAAEKCAEVGKIIDQDGCDGALITMTDSVAWLLNIRGTDVDHVPVALSTALLHNDGKVDWFIDPVRVPQSIQAHLGANVNIIDPNQMAAHLSAQANGQTVSIDDKVCAKYFEDLLKDSGYNVAYSKEPVYLPRARKTPEEQNAMREAHIRDGVAVVKFLKWIEENGPKGTVSEVNVDEKLIEFRSLSQTFQDTSFDTIAGWADNGAIVHYRATPEKHKVIQPPGILLVDSGAQYNDGTTDITRTIAIGAPTETQREMFTRVLKGHIGVAKFVFPQGTTGKEVDVPARQPLLDIGKNFGHGTGHGVGCYLSVHEDSAGISPRSALPIHAGMILSNEPGYYETGEYGIRIESLIQTIERPDGQLAFETITMAPIDKALIDVSLLDADELDWLNAYHQSVYDTLAPLLDNDHKAWLSTACTPLQNGRAPKQAVNMKP
jgi:Xaa-Pro aminopeptidase